MPISQRMRFAEKIRAVRAALPAFVLVVFVFDGLYSGLFTVNEAASVAAIFAFVFAIIRGRLNWKIIKIGLIETAVVTGMLY